MKKIIVILVIALILIFIFYLTKTKHDIKISIEIENKTAKEIDEIIAKNIENKLLNLKEIKEVILISNDFSCNIYIKFKPFYKKDVSKIQRKIESFLNDLDFINSINYDENYNKNYLYLIITTNSNNYNDLEKLSNHVLDTLLNTRKINDIKILGLQQKAIYIYFSNKDLINFNLSIEDIKNLIKENNQNKTALKLNSSNYKTDIELNSNIKSIDDIKNITLPYRNNDFSTKFDDVFFIEEKVKEPINSEIYFNDKKAIILALSEISKLRLYLTTRKFKDIKIINPKFLHKYKIYQNKNLNFKELTNKYLEIEKDLNSSIGFIRINPYSESKFDELENNKITIFTTKRINYNHQKNQSNKIEKLTYKIDENKLTQQGIKKSEFISSLFANQEGLNCGYFWDKEDKVEIILKNEDNNNFVYSKKFKNLIDTNYFLNIELKSEDEIYFRKNHKISKPTF